MNLQLVKQYKFYNSKIDAYVTDDKDKVWLTRRQIGKALEYPHPTKAIDLIHRRHSERLDPFSDTIKMAASDGKSYETIVYSQKGVFEICRHSAKPKADSLIDKIWEIADEVLTTGSYGDSQMDKLDKMLEVANTMLQTQQEHEGRINTIENRAEEAEKALKQKELPIPSLLPSTSTRQKVNKLVKDYSQSNNMDFFEVWNRIYYQFSMAHHMDLGKQAKRYGLSRLEYLEFVNQIDDLYAVAYNLLI